MASKHGNITIYTVTDIASVVRRQNSDVSGFRNGTVNALNEIQLWSDGFEAAWSYITFRRQRRKQNQSETCMFMVLSLCSGLLFFSFSLSAFHPLYSYPSIGAAVSLPQLVSGRASHVPVYLPFRTLLLITYTVILYHLFLFLYYFLNKCHTILILGDFISNSIFLKTKNYIKEFYSIFSTFSHRITLLLIIPRLLRYTVYVKLYFEIGKIIH